MNYEEAKVIVQCAGLIDENDGHPDIHYIKIANLLAEATHYTELLDDYRRFHAWISHVNYDLIAEWDEMESEEE
tara:strand:+ start:3072 stop:3293 length:222 start_codon:yes stop_codon:yes gene_type:complete